MAKKDNFDFETESKFNLNLKFLDNLTKQQKGIILIAAVAIVLVIAIIVTIVVVGSNKENSNEPNGGEVTGGDDETNDVVQGEITSFYISSLPFDTSYYLNEEANYEGLSIFVRSSEGGGIYVDYVDRPEDFTITGFNSSVVNESLTITVEFGGGVDTFTVEVVETPKVPAVLESIYIDPMPQTTYTLEDAFVFNNARIVAVYSDGTTKSEYLLMSHIDGFGAIDTLGEHEIKICYFDENGGYAETTLTITIVESIEE